ncbi:MAG: hypothetical protein FWH53_05850, partial [Leptospirales bacterium]|nr:hypothetical protein [Leptospirales bacterium]
DRLVGTSLAVVRYFFLIKEIIIYKKVEMLKMPPKVRIFGGIFVGASLAVAQYFYPPITQYLYFFSKHSDFLSI